MSNPEAERRLLCADMVHRVQPTTLMRLHMAAARARLAARAAGNANATANHAPCVRLLEAAAWQQDGTGAVDELDAASFLAVANAGPPVVRTLARIVDQELQRANDLAQVVDDMKKDFVSGTLAGERALIEGRIRDEFGAGGGALDAYVEELLELQRFLKRLDGGDLLA